MKESHKKFRILLEKRIDEVKYLYNRYIILDKRHFIEKG